MDLVRGGGPGCIASQALLSSLQEVLRPAIVQVLRDPLAATQLGNAVLAAQALQNDPDLLLGRIVLARRPSDVLNNLLSWFLRCSGLLSPLRSCERYDEPETLPYSIHPVCPMSADGGQELMFPDLDAHTDHVTCSYPSYRLVVLSLLTVRKN